MAAAVAAAALAAVAALAGLVAGTAFFVSLAPLSRMLLRPRGALPAVILQLLRMLGLAAVLVGLARWGAVCLLAGLAGILGARTLVLRRARRREARDG